MNTEKYTPLSDYDLHFITRRLPKVVVDLMKLHGRRLIVAGGFLRSVIAGEHVNDIDLFIPSYDHALMVATGLKTSDRNRILRTDNAITVTGHKVPIQIIHRWTYERPGDVVASFDFTIASASVWYDEVKKEWCSLCHPEFYADLAAKRIVYTAPVRNEEAGGSLLRVLKFYQRGYTMPLGSLGRIIGRLLGGVDDEKLNNRKGMDRQEWEQQIGHVLTGLLRAVDPLIDPDHIMHTAEPGGFKIEDITKTVPSAPTPDDDGIPFGTEKEGA